MKQVANSAEAVLKPADPDQERCADGQRQYSGSVLKAVSPTASFLNNQNFFLLTELRIAYLCVLLFTLCCLLYYLQKLPKK